MSAGEAILNLLFPPKCAFCGALMEEPADGLCPACRSSLPYPSGKGELRTVGGFPCAVALRYEAMVRQGVHALKFHDHPQRARVFARYLAQASAEQFPGGFDTVTFVPVSLWRNYRRGYDQAQLLAEEAAKLWGRIRCAGFTENTEQSSPIHRQNLCGTPGQRAGRLHRAPPGAGKGTAVPSHRRRAHHRQYHGRLCPVSHGRGSGERGVRRPGRGGKIAIQALTSPFICVRHSIFPKEGAKFMEKSSYCCLQILDPAGIIFF